jgi:hypothetical protein
MQEKDVGTSTTSAQAAILASIVNALSQITAAISDATTTIDGHTDTKVAALQVALQAYMDALQAAVNAHTDAQVAGAVATIDGHTDTAATATQAAITTAITAAQTALIAALPPATWSHVINGTVTARQMMVGVFATLLGNALGMETENVQFFGLDGTTVRVSGTHQRQRRSPGAFSSSYPIARNTPIVLDVDAPAGYGIVVIAKFANRSETYTILDTTDADEPWKWPFDANSSIDLDATPARVSLLPRDGWPPTPLSLRVFGAKKAVET